MKKISSVILIALSLALTYTAMAASDDHSYSTNSVQSVSEQASMESSNQRERVYWEPHLRIFNDTQNLVVVYTSNTKMTYYPGDIKDPYYGLLTWGAQSVVMLDKSTGEVFYSQKVVDETFLHITAQDVGGKAVYKVIVESMHDQDSTQ